MKKTLTFISGVVTAVICAVMNFVLLPKIEATTEGIRCFDMNFGYTVDTARKFLSLLSEEGKALYLNVQLPLDFIYPIAYCIFFSLLLISLSRGKKALASVPVVLAVFDYTENICSIITLKSGAPADSLIRFASAVTSVKTVLMYCAFLMIIICIIYYFKNKKKNESLS